jgi:hypothetical protein
MIKIEEYPLTKRLGKTRRKEIWRREIRGPSHHSSEITFQGQPTPKELRMIEEMGKIPRKQLIKC